MIEALDHIAIAVSDLDLAASAYEALLGQPADWREETSGARHAWSWLPTEFTSTRSARDMCRPISTFIRCGEARACAWPATEGMV